MFRQAESDWERVEADDDTDEVEGRAAGDVFDAFFDHTHVEVGFRVTTATILRRDGCHRRRPRRVTERHDGDGATPVRSRASRGVERVLGEEAEAERRCIGEPAKAGEDPTRPDIAWRIYCECSRPVHEVHRQWCGYRAVRAVEQALADEAEVRRLKELAHRVIRTLGSHDERRAELYLNELHTGAVTGPLVRPAPSAPRPAKVVSVEVPRRRYWA